jgi:hypothetical protein
MHIDLAEDTPEIAATDIVRNNSVFAAETSFWIEATESEQEKTSNNS